MRSESHCFPQIKYFTSKRIEIQRDWSPLQVLTMKDLGCQKCPYPLRELSVRGCRGIWAASLRLCNCHNKHVNCSCDADLVFSEEFNTILIGLNKSQSSQKIQYWNQEGKVWRWKDKARSFDNASLGNSEHIKEAVPSLGESFAWILLSGSFLARENEKPKLDTVWELIA